MRLDSGTTYIVLIVLDAEDRLITCGKQATSVLCDDMVVNYVGAYRIVRKLGEKLETRLGQPLE